MLTTSDRLELFPHNVDWSIQTLRLLAEGIFGGADVNEVYRASRRLRDGTVEVWMGTWGELAEEVAAVAEAAEADGQFTTARDAFLRASNYFRHAEFYLFGDDPRKLLLYRRGRACFRRAIPYCRPAIEPIEVPYGKETLDGYLCHPVSPPPGRAPLVVFLGGADSLAEELYFLGGRAVPERGAYLLLVDTPGRGSALRLKGIRSRPDYEVPVRAVLDWVLTRKEVDSDRIGLWGISMGGYYAPRAAAYNLDRVKALVCWCGCYSVLEDLYEFYPPIRRQLQWVVGAADGDEASRRLADFQLADAAPRVSCPTLIVHGAGDVIISPEGAKKLYAVLPGPKELRLLGAAEGGGMHCNYDNLGRLVPEMVDWLLARL